LAEYGTADSALDPEREPLRLGMKRGPRKRVELGERDLAGNGGLGLRQFRSQAMLK